jgi:hypothetical protein
MNARLVLLENTDLKRELAEARRALAYQQQWADHAERQIAAARGSGPHMACVPGSVGSRTRT